MPTKFHEKTKQVIFCANSKRLKIEYKLSNAHIFNQGICIRQSFIVVQDLKENVILGVNFLTLSTL